MRFYVICTVPRSGSNFLCRELTRHGAFGRPDEFFNFHAPMFRYASELQAQSFDDYIDRLLNGYSSPGVFGWKSFWFDFLFLRDMTQRLERFTPLTYIYLQRQDELAQAVSFAYAQASNAWTSEDQKQDDLPYDRASIDAALAAVRWNRQGWDEYFSAGALTPLRIDYDELTQDPRGVLQRIGQALDLPAQALEIDPFLAPLQAQREGAKAAWLQRYRQETET